MEIQHEDVFLSQISILQVFHECLPHLSFKALSNELLLGRENGKKALNALEIKTEGVNFAVLSYESHV